MTPGAIEQHHAQEPGGEPERRPPADPQHVPGGLLCGGCGYELVGLAASGTCPECGLAIPKSMQRFVGLEDMDPRWLAAIDRGLRWLEWTFICSVVYAVVAVVFETACSGRSWHGRAAWVIDVSWVACITATTAVGMFRLSTPHGRRPERPAWQRWSLRLAGGAWIVGMFGQTPVRLASVEWAGAVIAWVVLAIMFAVLWSLARLLWFLERADPQRAAPGMDLVFAHLGIGLMLAIGLVGVLEWIYNVFRTPPRVPGTAFLAGVGSFVAMGLPIWRVSRAIRRTPAADARPETGEP